MKILATMILAVFLFSAFPLEAFCHDQHQETETQHGHCILLCHSTCSLATAGEQKTIIIPQISAHSSTLSSETFSYQNPFLDTFKRPPVVFT